MSESEKFEKWFDEAGWKTGLPAKSLRPVWNNIKTWQNHIVDANKKVEQAALSTRKPFGFGIVDKDGKAVIGTTVNIHANQYQMQGTEGKLSINGVALEDESGSLVADLFSSDKSEDEIEANALRLVACWNEHDGLVKERDALKSELDFRTEAFNACHEICQETQKERDELVALLYDLLSVADADPELSQYPAAKAARELLAEKYQEAS